MVVSHRDDGSSRVLSNTGSFRSATSYASFKVKETIDINHLRMDISGIGVRYMDQNISAILRLFQGGPGHLLRLLQRLLSVMQLVQVDRWILQVLSS